MTDRELELKCELERQWLRLSEANALLELCESWLINLNAINCAARVNAFLKSSHAPAQPAAVTVDTYRHPAGGLLHHPPAQSNVPWNPSPLPQCPGGLKPTTPEPSAESGCELAPDGSAKYSTLCYEGDCAKMTGRARPCPIHDEPAAPERHQEAHWASECKYPEACQKRAAQEPSGTCGTKGGGK